MHASCENVTLQGLTMELVVGWSKWCSRSVEQLRRIQFDTDCLSWCSRTTRSLINSWLNSISYEYMNGSLQLQIYCRLSLNLSGGTRNSYMWNRKSLRLQMISFGVSDIQKLQQTSTSSSLCWRNFLIYPDLKCLKICKSGSNATSCQVKRWKTTFPMEKAPME